ncbi:hypothetical protein NP233_g8611 [Leucocoprinus birnbaumii]|uniref:Uncharacterized protein n=1 Tax=Leucocoprinus birnbaumii TaxID=56174 RepID=A0AAD5VNP9_9AGAR|nr:hypothetical protein NP233_g8611 [Leucocoprinus birnbaumii]
MRALKSYALLASALSSFAAALMSALLKGWLKLLALVVLYVTAISFTTIELLAGTLCVKKDGWVVYEDHLFPGHDPIPFIKQRDPSYFKMIEWGARQLIPKWNVLREPHAHDAEIPRAFRATLVDLRTGVYTKAMVTERPNNMVVLAVHGSGITCMLLKREEKPFGATVSTKLGMVNVPPLVLAEAGPSGTVYVGGGALCKEPLRSPSLYGSESLNLQES